MADAQPDWNLLPHRPADFFGLDDDFDLRALKRSYNAFLRQFKPEKFPAEFQQIRSAFESLRDEIRYRDASKPDDARPAQSFDWSQFGGSLFTEPTGKPVGRSRNDEDENESRTDKFPDETRPLPSPALEPLFETVPDETPPEPVPRPLHERIEQESPEDLYRELLAIDLKSPFDYYALALLSDVVAKPRRSFAGHLLDGLKHLGEEPGLFRLLREFLSSNIATNDAPAYLIEAAETLKSGRFYYLTEPLWDRLLREADFVTFEETLTACEDRIGLGSEYEQATFLLHILKPAMWIANEDWIDATLHHVTQMTVQLHYSSEEELDFVEMLRSYRRASLRFAARGRCCARIHQAIVDYCVRDTAESDRNLLGCMQMLRRNGRQLLNELPYDPKDRSTELYTLRILFDQISDEVAERYIENDFFDSELEPHQVNAIAIELMDELDRAGYQVLNNGMLALVGLPALAAVIALVSYYLYHFSLLNLAKSVGVILAGGALLVAVVWMKGWFIEKRYQSRIRFALPGLLAANPVAQSVLADGLATVSDKIGDRETDVIVDLVLPIREDDGVYFFSTACRFLL